MHLGTQDCIGQLLQEDRVVDTVECFTVVQQQDVKYSALDFQCLLPPMRQLHQCMEGRVILDTEPLVGVDRAPLVGVSVIGDGLLYPLALEGLHEFGQNWRQGDRSDMFLKKKWVGWPWLKGRRWLTSREMALAFRYISEAASNSFY